VSAWTLGLVCIYVVLRWVAQRVHGKEKDNLSVIGDALRFAGSVLILLGVLYPYPVLAAIGNLGPFLIYAGAAGLYSSLKALWK
jgi:hypothetical protein